MFKVNLYPEYEHGRRRQKKQTFLLGATAFVVCVQILVIGLQIMNTSLLSEQIDGVAADLPGLQQFVQRNSETKPEVGVAEEIVALRDGRVDWAPKLAAVAETVGDSLYLVELRFRNDKKGTAAEIEGVAFGEGDQLAQITVLMSDLRSHNHFGDAFASITLGNVRDGEGGEFQVNCLATGGER